MAMKHDSNATYDEVANLGSVEGAKYFRECAARHAAIVAWPWTEDGLPAPPPDLAASPIRTRLWGRYAAISTSIGSPNSTGQRCAYPAPATNEVWHLAKTLGAFLFARCPEGAMRCCSSLQSLD